MPFTDFLVLLAVIIATSAATMLLWRQGIRGRSLLAAAWLSFYGFVLTGAMLAHSAEVLMRAVARAADSDFASIYNFRLYSLLLLPALLIWAGVRCLRAAPGLGRRSAEARRAARTASVVVLAIVAPLIPFQTLFGILFTGLSILSLIVLIWVSPTPKSVSPEVQASL